MHGKAAWAGRYRPVPGPAILAQVSDPDLIRGPANGPFDLLVINGTLVSGGGRRHADLGVREGRIAAIFEPGAQNVPGASAGGGDAAHATEILDARGLFVLPGVIDGHVHFREPGLEHKEDWLSGSRAAVHGGVTTVLEMPNTQPPTRSLGDARAKLALAASSAHCDFGIFGLLDPPAMAGIAEVATSGQVVGLKAFLGPSTGDIASPSDDELLVALGVARAAGLRTAFHAEDAATLRWSEADVADRSDALAHLDGRPPRAEVAAIERIGGLLSRAGAAGHILHLSSEEGIDAVRRWRSRGVDLTCEVTPQHVLLGVRAYDELGGQVKCNPPVRGEPHASALATALADGTIDCVASDHAPHAPAEKSDLDIRRVAAGVAGVETLLPLMLSAVDAGRLTLERLVEVSAEAPARIWGLGPAKGSLEVGADADLVVVELAREGVIRGAELHGRHPLTPFEGRATHGAVVATLVRGRVAVRDGRLGGAAGWGRPVTVRGGRS